MKKIYILAAMVAFAFNANAQFDDDMEFYTVGEMADQNSNIFSVWSGDTTDGTNFLVTEAQAQSGTKSLLAEGGNGDDPLILLGNLTSGTYTFRMATYIPAGKTGYFNVQGETENGGAFGGAGIFNSSNIYLNQASGAPGEIFDEGTGETASYPEGAWFNIDIFFDLDAATPTYQITVDGALLNADPVDFADDTTLGGINVFPIDGATEMYVDDVLFVEGEILDTNEFSASNFSVYPNPVSDIMNIESTGVVSNVTVYDVLGKVVLQATPGVVSPSINTSTLSSGAYLVSITIDGAQKTIKVIK